MKYEIRLEKAAVKFIEKQSPKQRKRLYEIISELPNGKDIKSLKGYKNMYRLRLSGFRIIYTRQDDIFVVTVINIDNRGDVYKHL